MNNCEKSCIEWICWGGQEVTTICGTMLNRLNYNLLRGSLCIAFSSGGIVSWEGIFGTPLSGSADGLEIGFNTLPHSPQNFFPSGILALQEGHAVSSFAPHSSQNLIPSRFSEPQWGHFIFCPLFSKIKILWKLRIKRINQLETYCKIWGFIKFFRIQNDVMVHCRYNKRYVNLVSHFFVNWWLIKTIVPLTF